MKILIFAEVYYPDILGGGEFSTKQMAEGLARRGHKVTVRCLGATTKKEVVNGVCIKRKYIKGLSEHFLSNTKNNRIEDPFTKLDKIARKWGDIYLHKKCYKNYRFIISSENPNVVHTVSPMSYLGRYNLWKAAYDLNIPVSHVCRGPNLLELKFVGGMLDNYNRRRNRKAFSYLTALAAPSKYMLDCHYNVGIRGQSFNEVIYNSVDFEPVHPSLEDINKKKNIILYAGEIKKEKGVHTLVRAMEGIEDARLLLIGRGELDASIKSKDRLYVIDWMERDKVLEYMKKARAVVLPSEWEEPYGRVLAEAILSGTLAIGSDKGGIPEVLGHNEDYIFKSGDIKSLRNRIETIIHMPNSKYLHEISKMQKTVSGSTDETYIDNWERFFLKQIN